MIADVIPLKRFQQLRRPVHFADNSREDNVNATDNLFKIKLINDMFGSSEVKPKESHSVDEQIMPCRTKRSKIRQYDAKKP